MTTFNPAARQLSPEQWKQLALEASEPRHTQQKAIGGIFLAFLIFAVTSSQLCAAFLGAFILLRLYNSTKQSHRNEDAILNYGCVAHVLDGDSLRDYINQAGPESALKQITWALTHGYQVSPDALIFLESQGVDPDALLNAALTPQLPPHQANPDDTATIGNETRLQAIDVAAAPAPAVPTLWTPQPKYPIVDIAGAIATTLKPLIISAKPRVGKGVIVAQAWRNAKQAHPDLTVWVLQPKPHPLELGYWLGADQFWGRFIEDRPINDAEIASELTQFIFDWRGQGDRPTLLIVDELVKLEACQPKWYKDFLIPTLKVEASSGETDQRYLWALTQSPLITDLGMSGGNRSAFDFLAIEQAASLDHAESIRKSVSSIKDIPNAADYGCSPVGNLCFHSRANRWMAVPSYPVHEVQPSPIQPAIQPAIQPKIYPESTEVYHPPTPETVSEPPPKLPENQGNRPNLSRTELALTIAELSEWIEATNLTDPADVYEKWKSRKHGFTRPEIRFLLKLITALD